MSARRWLRPGRVRRLLEWSAVATVASYPLLTTDAAALARLNGQAYAFAVLAGAGGLAVLDVPTVCRRLRARFGMTVVWTARSGVVWLLVVAAASLAGEGSRSLLFLLVVPLTTVALSLPSAALVGFAAASIGAALAVAEPGPGWSLVWTVVVVGTALWSAGAFAYLDDEVRRRREAQGHAARRAELLNVVATTSFSSHGLGADEVIPAVVNGALGLGVAAAIVYESDPRAGVYRCREAAGVRDEAVSQVCPLSTADAVAEVLRSGQPVIATAGDVAPSVPRALVVAGFACVWAAPVFVDDDVVAVLCALDHEERLPAEDELVTMSILADRLGDVLAHDRRSALQRQAIARLREAERLKDDFVSTISHELRSPATVIKAANETLFTRWEQLDAAMRDHLRERIDSNADQLASLLDALLAYRELDAGRLQPDPHPVELADVMGAVRRRVEGRGDAAGHALDWHVDDVTVVADHDQLRRVIAILVDNAITHTPSGTRVTVTARRRDGSVQVVVSDDGPGIDPEQLEVLRRPFARHGDVLTRETAGLGLGLAIAELILHGHGRHLDIDSIPGQGTRCSFDLPVHADRIGVDDDEIIVVPDVDRTSGPDR